VTDDPTPTPPRQSSRRARVGFVLTALLLLAALASGLTLGLEGGSPASDAHDGNARRGVESFKESHPSGVAPSKSSSSGVNAGSGGHHTVGERQPDVPPGVEGAASEVEATASFTISGRLNGALAPGVSSAIALTLANPNTVTIYVTSLRTAASGGGSACAASENLAIVQSNASSSLPVAIPAHRSVTLPAQGVYPPAVELRNLPVDQDACANASFSLSYGGSARS
jgi:hypothetical protein